MVLIYVQHLRKRCIHFEVNCVCFRDLCLWEAARERAVSNYEQQKASMHPLAATMVGKDLKVLKS